MMRALWTGASGMISQQTSLDTISHNLANVNTTGYKKEATQFQTLLYQKIQSDMTDSEGNKKPVIGQVGLGTKVSGVVSQFTQGNLMETGADYDMAISGNGFFMMQLPDGTTGYTRSGSFQVSVGTQGMVLATSDGYPVLDNNGQQIVFDSSYDLSELNVDEFGNISLWRETPVENNGTENETGGNTADNTTGETEKQETEKVLVRIATIGRAQFNNPAGLEKQSNSILRETENSGAARIEGKDAGIKVSKILSGYLEGSNVQVADELVNMIVTQRAYQMNSKAITAADEMLQQANSLTGQ